jgi:hypothetical protein
LKKVFCNLVFLPIKVVARQSPVPFQFSICIMPIYKIIWQQKSTLFQKIISNRLGAGHSRPVFHANHAPFHAPAPKFPSICPWASLPYALGRVVSQTALKTGEPLEGRYSPDHSLRTTGPMP